MSETGVSLGQIAQLHEIERALRRHELPGLGNRLQVFLDEQRRRLAEPRMKIAWRLCDADWLRAMPEYDDFEAYLASVPPIPVLPAEQDRMGLQPFYVDPRVIDEFAFVAVGVAKHDIPIILQTRGQQRPQHPYWMWCDVRREACGSFADGRGAGWQPWEHGITLSEALTLLAIIGKPSKSIGDIICLGSICGDGDMRGVPVITDHATCVRMQLLRDVRGITPTCIIPVDREKNVVLD